MKTYFACTYCISKLFHISIIISLFCTVLYCPEPLIVFKLSVKLIENYNAFGDILLHIESSTTHFPYSTEMEVGLLLIISEILKLITKLLHEKSTVESVWQHCQNLISHLSVWAEDHCTTGILAAIGLGRQSPMSLKFRLVCRVVATFLNLQMPQEGVFRIHPLQAHR